MKRIGTLFGCPVIVMDGVQGEGMYLVDNKTLARLWAESAHELYPWLYPAPSGSAPTGTPNG
jgi:hypothetical protein